MKMAAVLAITLESAALCVWAQDTRTVIEPRIPPVCSSVAAKLKVVDGKTLAPEDESKADTQRIQQALDACPAGQGVELKVDGANRALLSGPLQLRAGVTLVVAKGAVLFASRNPRDYDVTPGSCGVVNNGGRGCKPLIAGDNVANAGVMGDGIIDGRGWAQLEGQTVSWWDLAQQARTNGHQQCPRILVLNGCNNFTLYKITLKNSPNFHVAYNGGNGFTAWGVVIDTPKAGRNTDGIDPGNSTNITITHCYINAGDDNVAVKAGRPGPTTNITISHNHFYAGHGVSIGSETDGGLRNMLVTDLSIDGADNGIRIKSNASRGGKVEHVVYDDVCIRDTKNPILMDTHYSAAPTPNHDHVPLFTDIMLRNVRIEGQGKVTLDGYDEQHRLGITFDNVVIDDLKKIKFASSHAVVKIGPGPVNFKPEGVDVTVEGSAGQGAENSCQAKFVPMPSTAVGN
ncbi:MAG TPA: glycosyl hydrolase family 28 protein [Bryobacteraceae bacterium]|nr:glycosyl hydrolase family 28 protein [Bryobacteraceae bacterium]HUA60346.1 glycosyl hydrolase family 28 protein [Verrucomicrobiae bacterium]